MRVCWNWQTGTFEGRVFQDVRVQVPSLAPYMNFETKVKTLVFLIAFDIIEILYRSK